jgi:hypothetical protein
MVNDTYNNVRDSKAMSLKKIECPIYEPNPGDRIRIVIRYQQSWRPMFWFKLATDGSIYLGPRLKEISELKMGKAKSSEGNQFRVRYSDGKAIDDPEIVKKAKLSFHASGIVNSPAGRTRGEIIRSLKDQTLLCVTIFRHPSYFDTVDDAKITNRDICLNLPIDEQRPLWGQLWIAPTTKQRAVIHDMESWQINTFFCYKGLQDITDLTVQFMLAYGAKGSWPPYNYLIFREVNAV